MARVLGALGEAGQLGSAPGAEHGIPDAPLEVFGATRPLDATANAAVLVGLFEERGEARVLLTRRSAELRSHTGQVSFPGGRLEPGEPAESAALREAHEEVHLDPRVARPVGWLHPVVTMASRSTILPIVAELPGRPTVEANPTEVARVFDVALADLLADGAFREERWTVPRRPASGSPDGSFPVWFFDVAGETVWGATARMLVELLRVALGLGTTDAGGRSAIAGTDGAGGIVEERRRVGPAT